MANPDHSEDDVPSLKQLFRWPKSKSPRTPSLTRGIAILSACIGIYLFVAFVPARPGHQSNKYYLSAIALYWTVPKHRRDCRSQSFKAPPFATSTV